MGRGVYYVHRAFFLTIYGIFMKKILDGNVHVAEYARQHFRIVVPYGHTIDDVKKPEYWANVARKFNPHDLVEFVAEDGSFYAEAIVLDKGPLWAKVFIKNLWDLNAKAQMPVESVAVELPTEIVDETAYEVKWGGPSAKFRIHKKDTNELLAPDSFQTKEDALAFLVKFKSRIAA